MSYGVRDDNAPGGQRGDDAPYCVDDDDPPVGVRLSAFPGISHDVRDDDSPDVANSSEASDGYCSDVLDR